MAISSEIPSPTFVEFEARVSTGLDLLGLRIPVQAIGNRLLNGITTVTPTVRYFSLRTWLLHQYMQAEPRPADLYRNFVAYAKHAEAAFTMANLLRDPEIQGLIGPNKGREKLDQEKEPWSLEPLVKQPAVRIYGSPSDELRLTQSRGEGIPILVEELGLPLAEAVEQRLGVTAIGRRLKEAEPLDRVSSEELREFGELFWAGEVPEGERRALVAAILPKDPGENDIRRVGTYALILNLARLDGSVDEMAVFREALSPMPRVSPLLAPVLDEWALYTVRDVIAVTAEMAFEAVVRFAAANDPDRVGIEDDRLVRQFLDRTVGDQESSLRELRLLDRGESLEALSLHELSDRVVASSGAQGSKLGPSGIRRWEGGLTEPSVWNAALGARDGAMILVLTAWLLAERRVAGGENDQPCAISTVSRDGYARFGMSQRILPRLADWRKRNLGVAEVVAELTHLLLDQHLRIVWSRLASDPSKDVSVLLRDGNRIIWRSEYSGGRFVSRIPQAIRWLHQMEILAEGSLTPNGEDLLDRVLDSLEGA